MTDDNREISITPSLYQVLTKTVKQFPLASFVLLSVTTASFWIPAKAQLPELEPVPHFTGSQAQPTNSLPEEAAYTLGAGDRVRIDIFDVEEYSGEYQVLVDGSLNLPIIGSVQVAGLTLQEAAEVLSQQYARYVRRPLVTVSLLTPRSIKIAVAGEVNSPGSYTVTLDQNSNQFPTVTEAVELAGGITPSAAVRQVQLRRSTKGREQVVNVDLWALLERGDMRQNLKLRDGDTLFIPTATDISPVETRQLIASSLAPKSAQPVQVAVVGEVSRPGSYTIEPEAVRADGSEGNNARFNPPTLTQAIDVAGGIKPMADLRNVTVRRVTRSGEERLIDVNLWELLQSGDLSQDVILQEGDTILVAEASELTPPEAAELAEASFSPDTIKVNVVGEVQNPGAVEVPPNTPLNQALLAAGGFDKKRAKESSVELIRLNPNGTATKRKIEIDFSEGINEETNPPLRSNDVVVVKRSGVASTTDTLGTILSPLGGIFSIFRWLF